MEPFSRSVLYRTAFCTLARRRALAELRVYDLNLDAPTPFMSIRAETDKTRTARAIPIMNKDLLEDLKTLIAGKKRDDLVFHVAHATAAVLQNDLKDANIPYSTTEGDWDFHAFRHSGATHMARMRVPLYQICKIGGWTDYEQFFSTYGHMSVHDLGSSIDGIF
jgi:integrase